MFGTFINRIGSLLDRRFLIGSWFPALCGAFVVAAAGVIAVGWGSAMDKWKSLDGAAQVLLGAAALMAVTLAAFVLHVLPVIRLFEGYAMPAVVKELAARRHRLRRDRVPEVVSLRTYPRDSALIRPTRLGNVITAAEEHAFLRYRLDAVVWWPRLAPVLPPFSVTNSTKRYCP